MEPDSLSTTPAQAVLQLVMTLRTVLFPCFKTDLDIISFFADGPLVTQETFYAPGIKFYLYNQPETFNIYQVNQTMEFFQDPAFDSTKKTAIIFHGFRGTPENGAISVVTRSYLNTGLYNVALVRIEQFNNLSYYRNVIVAPILANIIGGFVIRLCLETNISPETFELCGLSLGAMAAGLVGRYIHSETSIKVGRLIGLDPSGACLRHVFTDRRIQKEDSGYTIIIHTNSEFFGTRDPLGHADIYFNDGNVQFSPKLNATCSNMCSHIHSTYIWQSFIKGNIFVSFKCENAEEALETACAGPMQLLEFDMNNNTIDGVFSVPKESIDPDVVAECDVWW